MKEKQYEEGPKARQKFEQAMAKLFRAPKTVNPESKKKGKN
jgi:hypothetical protein